MTEEHENKTIKRKKSTINRWQHAVRHVLEEKTSPDDEDRLEDLLARLLNENPAFRYQENKNGMDEEEESMSPLLSSRNLKRLYQSLIRRRTMPNLRFVHTIGQFIRYLLKDRLSILEGLRTLGWITLLTASVLAMTWKTAIMMTWHALLIVASLFSMVLIDFEEVKTICPKQVLSTVEFFVRVLEGIDHWILGGHWFGGREWNEDAFVPGVGDAASRKTVLLKCPPPPIQRRTRWSKRSIDHVESIQFCYDMIKHAQKHTRDKLKNAVRNEILRNATAEGVELLVKEDASTVDTSLFSDNKTTLSTLEKPRHVRVRSDDTRPSYSDDDLDNSGRFDLDRMRDVGAELDYSSQNEAGDDMDWAEVGARIGMRILSSEHVQRAVASQNTAERIQNISTNVGKNFATPTKELSEAQVKRHSLIAGDLDALSDAETPFLDSRSAITPMKPVHTMWTSPAAARPRHHSASSVSDVEDAEHSEYHGPRVPSVKRLSSTEERDLPPRSPFSTSRKALFRRQSSLESTVQRTLLEDHEELLSDPTKESVAVGECLDPPDQIVPKTPEKKVVDEVSSATPCRLEDDDTCTEVVLMNERDRAREISQGRRFSKLNLLIPAPARVPIRRPMIQPGTKMVVPIFPIYPGKKYMGPKISGGFMQMATVVSSKRVHVRTSSFESAAERRSTNCLSITVNLDKSFLRNGRFAQMTLRIMDSWSSRYMPRHSKFPIGSCVATTFGVGVLVGWRVEDDCHIVRALWQRRGPGSGNAYLNRDALHDTVEAGIGFTVETTMGKGVVVSYVGAGRKFTSGRYFVAIAENGRNKSQVIECNRSDILACDGPEFIPVIELIREAAKYQIQVDAYESALRQQLFNNKAINEKKWRLFSEGFEIIWSAFLKAVEEDEGFDNGVNEFFSSIIAFLERLDDPVADNIADKLPSMSVLSDKAKENEDDSSSVSSKAASVASEHTNKEWQNPYAWFVDDLFGGVFGRKKLMPSKDMDEVGIVIAKNQWNQMQYDKAFAFIRAMMTTVTIARADCKEHPNLKLALSIAYEILLFVRTVIKIQQRNVSAASLAVWERAIEEVMSTFGPVQSRLEKIGKGIAERIERHGNRAKIRIIRFVDIVVSDEKLLLALERGDWDTCLSRLEQAFVQARILEEGSRENYRKTIVFIMGHFSASSNGSRAAKNNARVMRRLAKAVKWMASPKRSLLKYIRRDATLEILQRIFVRVFRNDPEASRMIVTHAFNMNTLRQLRMLKDFTISGKLWIPMLDAADQELTHAVSKMPETSKRIMVPLAKLFSLMVAQFHKIGGGDLTADWMDFLLQEDAIELVHRIDLELIISVEAISKDVKEVMGALPYYASIDEDILNLIDEVNIDEFLKEASDAIMDPERLSNFIRDKSTVAIKRFLDYLPKMSIPVEQRDMVDNWVITCRSESGGDLTLSEVSLKPENLTCQVLGGETIFFSAFGDDETCGDHVEIVLTEDSTPPSTCDTDEGDSVLDEIRTLLLNAQKHGCWQSGRGGVGITPSDRYAASVLQGLTISEVLNTGIDLWRSLEIDDDELMEIAIKDVAFQIQLQKEREENLEDSDDNAAEEGQSYTPQASGETRSRYVEFSPRRRFNPRVDPTLLFVEMKKLTVNLDKFRFRIEKKKRTLFDPVFEGWGSLSIQNASIRFRVECRKEVGEEQEVPVLQCQELEVKLEHVTFKVQDTGADWILNKAVMEFADNITEMVEASLKEQVSQQVESALENLNAYFAVHPDLLPSLLGVTIDDLEENLVWV